MGVLIAVCGAVGVLLGGEVTHSWHLSPALVAGAIIGVFVLSMPIGYAYGKSNELMRKQDQDAERTD